MAPSNLDPKSSPVHAVRPLFLISIVGFIVLSGALPCLNEIHSTETVVSEIIKLA